MLRILDLTGLPHRLINRPLPSGVVVTTQQPELARQLEGQIRRSALLMKAGQGSASVPELP
jgi:hypothetical protein